MKKLNPWRRNRASLVDLLDPDYVHPKTRSPRRLFRLVVSIYRTAYQGIDDLILASSPLIAMAQQKGGE